MSTECPQDHSNKAKHTGAKSDPSGSIFHGKMTVRDNALENKHIPRFQLLWLEKTWLLQAVNDDFCRTPTGFRPRLILIQFSPKPGKNLLHHFSVRQFKRPTRGNRKM
jgi:hypothetical protein